MKIAPALHTVLVSTDFSEHADGALAHAFRLAQDSGARLVLVHVLDAPASPNPLYANYYPIPTPEQMRQAAAKADEALRARIPAELHERAEAVVAQGSPAQEIVRIAAEKRASVIVLAAHGRTGLLKFALGSVAERVLRDAPCPVLVVR